MEQIRRNFNFAKNIDFYNDVISDIRGFFSFNTDVGNF